MTENWQSKSLCSGYYDLFFEAFNTKKFVDLVSAKSICSVCPVRVDCLDSSFQSRDGLGELSGIWGGFTPSERKKILKKINLDEGFEDRIMAGVDLFVKDFFHGIKA